ncbi:MAG: Rap1a/Tai family immunity protein [Alphaproteobacteria bacterium]|nr:Rap1a/Tai family immunity protein [Alphaproteobacteria bacterium]
MKKILFAALCACILFLTLSPAKAIYMTGAELTQHCAGDQPKDLYSCTAYIAGIIDYHNLIQSLGTAPTIDFCVPADMPIEQVAMDVLAYLKKEQQHGGFIATPAVTLALNKMYPCRKQK